DKLGYSVGGGGDTNGDGFDEVFLGALTDGGNGTNSGTVYIFLGSADGVDTTVDNRIYSASPLGEERFGSAVASAGDLNADGYDDLIVGAVHANDVDGAVYVYFGSVDGLDPDSEILLEGDSTSGRFGDQVARGRVRVLRRRGRHVALGRDRPDLGPGDVRRARARGRRSWGHRWRRVRRHRDRRPAR
ncbi:MAG: hypothetical protein GY913_33325, partial [Proteobacteria bacterium]|nr:hypothetical protein [Pseudomonadota bacterium]